MAGIVSQSIRTPWRRARVSGVAAVLALSALLVTAPKGWSITIITDFIASGNPIPGGLGTAGGAPVTAGGGNVTTIFDAAADAWESAILDAWTVTIHFAWAGLPGTTLGVHNLLAQGGAPNRESEGTIRFDNDGTTSWFLDATPAQNTEYGTLTTSSANLGGGLINTGQVYTSPSGDAVGRFDLFSVALHEIGHSLGLSGANTSFIAENGDSDIDVTAPRSFPGTTIPTVSGAHLDIASALMYPTFPSGRRKLASEVDVLANCQISQCDQVVSVPEPGNVFLLALSLIGLVLWQRSAKSKEQ